jgi:hypothetical protein
MLPLFPGEPRSARFWPTGNCTVRVTASADLTIEAQDLTTAPPNKLGAETAAEMIAAELAISRLKGLHQCAAAITEAEKAGTLVEPGWQAKCRQYARKSAALRAKRQNVMPATSEPGAPVNSDCTVTSRSTGQSQNGSDQDFQLPRQDSNLEPAG